MKLIKKFSTCLFIFCMLSSIFLCSVNATDDTSLEINSPAAIMMDFNTGKILYEKNINEVMYPASLTKVMTAILVLENCDLNEIATVSSNAVDISYGYVTANLQIGEELTVEQLLYVLLVGSSNDAAIVLAEHVSGSTDAFAKLMNQKAKEVGCTSTNFVNPNGEHNENHYSTAYDLALIARYAMQNETFKKMIATTSYTLPATNKYSNNDRSFTTTNALLISSNSYYYKYATGVKTGYTTPAGNCLIASAVKDNIELITVVLGAGQTSSGASIRYEDTKNLFEYGFENYTIKQVIKAGGTVQTISISNATQDTKNLEAIVENDINALIKSSDEDTVFLPDVTLNENLKAPISQGDVIGTVKYTIDGIEYTENLIAKNDVNRSYLLALITVIVIVIILIYSYILHKKKLKRQNLGIKLYK